MDSYSLSKDDFDAILELQLTPSGGVVEGAAITPVVKAALT